MADQVKSLMEHGISVAHLHGGKKDFEVLPGLQSGKYRVLSLHQRSFYAKWPSISAFYHHGIDEQDWPACN